MYGKFEINQVIDFLPFSYTGRKMLSQSHSHASHSSNDAKTISERQKDPHSHAVVLDPFFGKIAFVTDLVSFLFCIKQSAQPSQPK